MKWSGSAALWLASVLVLLGTVATVLALSGQEPSQDVFSLAPAELVVPSGGVLQDAAGATVDEFARSTGDGQDVLRVPVLDPGRYFVSTPAPTVAGAFAPTSSSIVVVADVLPEPASPAEAPWWAVVVLAALAVLAGLSVLLRGVASMALAAVVGVGLAVLAVAGLPAASAAGVVGFVLAVVAFALLYFSAPAGPWRSRAVPAVVAAAAVVVATALAPWPAMVALLLAIGVQVGGQVSARLTVPLSAFAAAVMVGAVLVSPAASADTWEPVAVSPEQCAQLLRGTPDPDSGQVVDRRQEGLECFRALAAQIGATAPVAEASERVLSVARSLEGIDPTMVCRQMGEAMSSAASRFGPGRSDPRLLFVDLSPVCDYSSMHGISPGVFLRAPSDGLADQVVALCSDATPDETRLADYEYKAQCWQGTGIMLARKFNFDPALFDVCALAPHEGLMNCSDGVFRELIDQMARSASPNGSVFVPQGVSVASLCRGLTGELIGGCYRYVGEETEVRAGTNDKTVGAQAIFDVCTSGIPAEHEKYCWYAVGMITVRAYPDLGSQQALGKADDLCRSAPEGEPRSECYVGATNAVLNRNAQDLRIDEVCAWFPPEDRDRLCENARFYYQHLVGSDAS